MEATFDLSPEPWPEPPAPVEMDLPSRRLPPPPDDAAFAWSDGARDRVVHAAGKSYRDLVRLRRGRVDHPPDVVARPGTVDELVEVLAWADRVGAAVVPFGGGTSVTGGVEPEVPSSFEGAVSVDLGRLDRVLEVDPVSRLCRVEAGLVGPALEEALGAEGLAFRHYPQSYRLATVGGMIATRSSGHFATRIGSIEERVAALEVVAPDGRRAETRLVPRSSVGPDPDRLWIGSEGTLGVITKAWLRAVPVPRHRRTLTVRFPDLPRALEMARPLVQDGPEPSVLRIMDPREAMMSAALSGDEPDPRALAVLGYESGDRPVDAAVADARTRVRAAGGEVTASSEGGASGDGAGGWKEVFFRQPHLRDVLVGWGVIVDTFETAVPWRGAAAFFEEVREATREAVLATCGTGGVLGRATHFYPDGVAFYFTFFGPGEDGRHLEQWRTIKAAATEAVLAGGGTVSHHHACGRDHVPWAARELPDLWRDALRAARREIDPAGRMNPGVILEAGEE